MNTDFCHCTNGFGHTRGIKGCVHSPQAAPADGPSGPVAAQETTPVIPEAAEARGTAEVDALTYDELEAERDRLARELYEAQTAAANLTMVGWMTPHGFITWKPTETPPDALFSQRVFAEKMPTKRAEPDSEASRPFVACYLPVAGDRCALRIEHPGDCAQAEVVPEATPGPQETTEAPDDVYRVIAADRAVRWGYRETLDASDLAAYIHDQAKDRNLRADADVVWREVRRPLLADLDRVTRARDYWQARAESAEAEKLASSARVTELEATDRPRWVRRTVVAQQDRSKSDHPPLQ